MTRELVSGVLGASLLALALWLTGEVRSSEPVALRPAESLRSPSDVRPVASYTLAASLDVDRHVISGTGSIMFVNVSDAPLSALFVHLYLNAFEHERTVFRRERSLGFRGWDRVDEPGHVAVKRFRWREESRELWPAGAHTPGDPEDRTDIEVPLPRPIRPGETATFEIEFESQLPSVVLRTGFAGSFHMAGQWFPKLAKLEPDGTFAHFPFQRFSEFYADFGDYDVTIDV
ncbi:MAG: M1 family peptidase, partial [Myxococcales bacterium]|nr:M1 family peptidase [Myxococcales bacterium]